LADGSCRSSLPVKLSNYNYNYKLCPLCFERQTGIKTDNLAGIRRARAKKGRRQEGLAESALSHIQQEISLDAVKPADCYVCSGIMNRIDTIVQTILEHIKDYEFETFLIGATLPAKFFEREDSLRARFKIRGKESIKNHLTRELGSRLATVIGKKVDYLTPDITIGLAISSGGDVDVAVKSRPLAFSGRYKKTTRNLPQRQERCEHCQGAGCDKCGGSGYSGGDSIEGIIARKLISLLRGQSAKFSWVGGEDQSSLVLGSGRPFYVRVFNPQRRNIAKGQRKIVSRGIRATIEQVAGLPDSMPVFTTKTRILIRCDKDITRQDIANIRALAGSTIRLESKSKVVEKKIYSCNAVRRAGPGQLIFTITADGGLTIKQFVGGNEYAKPSVSELVGAKCDCILFDVLDVIIV
jgi:tRNA pseudouridine synthase 10